MTDDASFFNPVNLKTAVDIGKTLVSLARQAESKGLDAQYAAELNGKIADMQTTLFDARQDALDAQRVQFEQSARIRELEQTIAEFENWEAEKARYKLVNDGQSAAFVYLLRQEAAQDNELLHYICPRCYGHRFKSILQRNKIDGSMRTVCPECNSTFRLDYEIARSHGVFR